LRGYRELECQIDFFELRCPDAKTSTKGDPAGGKGVDRIPSGEKVATSPVLEVYQLKHANAEATVKLLASFFENCEFAADSRTNALIVRGTREQQEKIQQAIRSLDVPAPGER
jgi:type II secretory pathway component GspD/PulD (secretin)